MVKCTFCDQNAIFSRPYSGEKLCRKCFIASIERRVCFTISEFRMFTPKDHIALALSGGKDSISLLYILSKIEKDFPNSTLTAISIDEGIRGYREEAIDHVRERCQKLNVPLHIYSFQKIYGKTLDQIAKKAKVEGRLSICSYCGVLRRKALNLAAKDIQATKLALAHNLDDEVQSMFLSVIRGDLYSLTRVRPILEKLSGFVQRVKPLCQIMEREIVLYAHLKGIRFQKTSCPYSESSMRNDVRRFINHLEAQHSGVKYAIYRTFHKIHSHLKGLKKREKLKHCKICGEPSSKKICRSCEILTELDLTGSLKRKGKGS